MCNAGITYRSFFGLCLILALLSVCQEAYSQKKEVKQKKDSKRIRSADTLNAIVRARDSLPIYPEDTIKNERTALRQPRIATDKFILMVDSLKVRTSKNLVAKKIFDLLIVSKEPLNKRQLTGTSEFNFLMYSGRVIRNIKIMRLNVFGTNINAPLYYEPGKLQELLNKTHINTNESIIRRSLLFSEGDKVSALTMSDNERLLRNLPFINDARIIVLPISDNDVDVVVITKDVYSIGGTATVKGMKSGRISLFDRNLLGMGHELELGMPYNSNAENSPGFGIDYTINNLHQSFIKMKINYFDGFNHISLNREKTYGISLTRELVSATTKYAGGISVNHMTTRDDLQTLPVAETVKYNLQDYWLSRSFLLDRQSVTRFIIGARYKNNNVFDRPFILPYSYYNLQKYKIFLGSISLSTQRFYKTNLIYSYGRTEDIPYGGLFKVTAGKEINEFKRRTYIGSEVSFGKSNQRIGYLYGTVGLASFLNNTKSEQGVMKISLKYFSNLVPVRDYMIRNFINVNYTRGFDRYIDESIKFTSENGFSGFRNDSIKGGQRISLSLESVLFSPTNFYGFRFALFAWADASFLRPRSSINGNTNVLTGIGFGMRIRNNNFLINTFQIRLGFFPNLPAYSNVSYLSVSGEQLLRPGNFEPGPPSIIPYQ